MSTNNQQLMVSMGRSVGAGLGYLLFETQIEGKTFTNAWMPALALVGSVVAVDFGFKQLEVMNVFPKGGQFMDLARADWLEPLSVGVVFNLVQNLRGGMPLLQLRARDVGMSALFDLSGQTFAEPLFHLF